MCHAGPCEKPGQQCTQPCTTMRELCGHICAASCHEGKCPDTPCKEMVKVKTISIFILSNYMMEFQEILHYVRESYLRLYYRLRVNADIEL